MSVGAPVHYRRDAITRVSFVALFAFGVLNAVLGPALPYLRQAERISYLTGSLHQVAFAVGGMSAGYLAVRAWSPRSRRVTICGGLGAAAFAGLALGYGDHVVLTCAAAFLLSAFGTTALIRVWATLADRHGAARAVAMTEGEVSVSLAGVLTPAIVAGCAATALGWRFAFVVAAVLVVAAAVAAGLAPIPPAADGALSHTTHGLRRRTTLVVIFGVVGLEFTLNFWSASYLSDDVGLPRETAVSMVVVLYAAQFAGRALASRLARRVGARALLLLALATALAGTPVLLAAGNAAVAATGLVITGAGIGATFPLASALHVGASARTADEALGEILLIAGAGQIAGPLAAGAVAQAVGLRAGLLVVPVLAALAVAGTVAGGRRDPGGPIGPAVSG